MSLWNTEQRQSMREFLLGYGFNLTYDNVGMSEDELLDSDDWMEEWYKLKLQGDRDTLEIDLYRNEFETPFGDAMYVDLSVDVGDSISTIKEVINIYNRLQNLSLSMHN